MNSLPPEPTPPSTTRLPLLQSQPYSAQQVQSEYQTQQSHSHQFKSKPRKHTQHYSYEDIPLPTPDEYNTLIQNQMHITNHPTEGVMPPLVQPIQPLPQTPIQPQLITQSPMAAQQQTAPQNLPAKVISPIPQSIVKTTAPIQQALSNTPQVIQPILQGLVNSPVITPSPMAAQQQTALQNSPAKVVSPIPQSTIKAAPIQQALSNAPQVIQPILQGLVNSPVITPSPMAVQQQTALQNSPAKVVSPIPQSIVKTAPIQQALSTATKTIKPITQTLQFLKK